MIQTHYIITDMRGNAIGFAEFGTEHTTFPSYDAAWDYLLDNYPDSSHLFDVQEVQTNEIFEERHL